MKTKTIVEKNSWKLIYFKINEKLKWNRNKLQLLKKNWNNKICIYKNIIIFVIISFVLTQWWKNIGYDLCGCLMRIKHMRYNIKNRPEPHPH